MWSSQFDSDLDDSEKISHQLRLSGGNEELYITVPLHYSINKNLRLFFDAREALLHRYLYNEYAIVAPSLCIHEELNSSRTEKSDNLLSENNLGNNQELFLNSKDISGVNGSDDLFSSLENKSTDTLMTQSPQKMKIKNISSDDSDMTLANCSVDLFSLSENESKEHCASATDGKPQNVNESLKEMNDEDSETCCSVASVSILKPKKKQLGRKIFICQQQIGNQDNSPSTSSSLQRLTGVREDKPIIISSTDSDCDSLSQSILRRKHPRH
ncbi:unnamed protein product [Mytilus coruscus]|uniref:Uncharacterized protein n=1 Tax=Mytilus coruscus TaxID=42192 RepID=A0A6J8EXZ7_MYTCO|nr:unnamed protein product [Mytilus coruscus]